MTAAPKSMHHDPLYVDTPEEAENFLAAIERVKTIAVDTEGASFHRFIDRIYLLQLSTRERSAVLDPLAIGKPPKLGSLLQAPQVEVVFHDADYDLRLLHQDYGWHATNLFDTRVAAQLLGLRAFGLAALLERFFGLKLDKKHQRADWSMRPLTPDMLRYAAQDTMYLLDLRDRLEEQLDRAGRWEWAQEEFHRLEGTRWDDDEASAADAYLRIKGARDLSRRELAIFREVVRWRDAVAGELDRATFRVAGNETLLELARQAPRTTDALVTVKGMPRGIVERRGQEVLAAIGRGVEVPDDQLPKFPRAQRWDRDPDFESRVSRLRAVRDQHANRLDLDPGVLCPRERLEAIARLKPASIEELEQVPDLRRWQIAELGADFVRAMQQS